MGARRFELSDHSVDTNKSVNIIKRRTLLERKLTEAQSRAGKLEAENFDLTYKVKELEYKAALLETGSTTSEELLTKINEAKECDDKLDLMGITHENRHVFKQKLESVIKAINDKTVIDEVDISEAIKNPNFRFYTKDQPQLSLEVSVSYAEMAKMLSKVNPDFMVSGRQKRTENADEYAKRMHEIINELNAKEQLTSFRKAAQVLNEKKIATPLNKEWQARTLIDLNKRWEAMGLSPFKPKPK